MLTKIDNIIILFISFYSILHIRKKLIINIYSLLRNIFSFGLSLFITNNYSDFIIKFIPNTNAYFEFIIFILFFIIIYLCITIIILLLKVIADVSLTSFIEKPLNLFIGLLNGFLLSIIAIYTFLLLPNARDYEISKNSFSITMISELKIKDKNNLLNNLFLSVNFNKKRNDLEKLYLNK